MRRYGISIIWLLVLLFRSPAVIRSFLPFAFILPICWASTAAIAADLILADAGKSDFRIVVAADAGPSTQYAAKELQSFLKQISDAELPIVTDREPVAVHEIMLGPSSHLKALSTSINFKRLGDEGYVIRAVGPHLVIAGGTKRGNLYGVYGLLEDHLGCRWFAPDVSRIPRIRRITLVCSMKPKSPCWSIASRTRLNAWTATGQHGIA